MTITAYKCTSCGHVMYPYHSRCLNCRERDFEEIQPTPKASLLTYTIIEQLPWGMDERGRILGVVEFENGIRALGLILVDQPNIGMKLKTGWGPVRDFGGVKVEGLIFEKAG